jgi:hypothetical protein
MQNAFEQLCVLASNENWCWKIYCTTCGHLHFRYSFLELANGNSPADKDWLIHSKETHYPLALPRYFTGAQTQSVISICREANLRRIAHACKFPDWLGYLGLVLHHFGAGDDARQLSFDWAAQLKDMVPATTSSHQRLQWICSSTGKLGLVDLEMIETDWCQHT